MMYGVLFRKPLPLAIRTFWFGLLWGIIGGITSLILIGWLVLLANAVWILPPGYWLGKSE